MTLLCFLLSAWDRAPAFCRLSSIFLRPWERASSRSRICAAEQPSFSARLPTPFNTFFKSVRNAACSITSFMSPCTASSSIPSKESRSSKGASFALGTAPPNRPSRMSAML